ncbi:hypothetical protein B0H16DRAFT_786079 [Mycena metata]|uniref:Uncharacterized protein n=1 Tax=Mycena metata TaxID=1033252 RepID=A0AAD7GQ39_9AGAR|nr:hypothetical protein B0H16DRAFT_786079 [Mycena metata]
MVPFPSLVAFSPGLVRCVFSGPTPHRISNPRAQRAVYSSRLDNLLFKLMLFLQRPHLLSTSTTRRPVRVDGEADRDVGVDERRHVETTAGRRALEARRYRSHRQVSCRASASDTTPVRAPGLGGECGEDGPGARRCGRAGVPGSGLWTVVLLIPVVP